MIVDGYVRVSEVKGRSAATFISPSVQREQIEGWANSRGAAIGKIFEELDESGGSADRPMLSELLARVEEGRTDGVVVVALDRLGRSLVDGLAAIERVQDAGGVFVSIREGLDLSTDTGKLVLRILLSMAEWELDRVRGRWDVARRRAVARRIHMAAYPPTGYMRDAERRLHPDPVSGPIVAELFLRRARGAAVGELCEFLAEQEVMTPAGRHNWAPAALHKLIQNRVYLGELHHGAMSNGFSHLPLTDPATWDAAQHPRIVARDATRRSPTVLGGLMRCAGCRMVMRSQVITRDGQRKRVYFCGRRFTAGECPSPAWITGAVAEPYFEAVFFALAARRRPVTPRAALWRQLTEAYERARQDVVDYRDSPSIRSSLGPTRFAEGLVERQRRERHASLAIAAERSRTATARVAPVEELEAGWPQLTVQERRALMSELIDCVFVARRESDEARMFVCARGDAPVDLPHRGKRSPGLVPFEPAGVRRAEPSSRQRPWSDARIGASLSEFLGDWKEARWPSEDEFIFAGRGPLLRQINRTGGPLRWASGTSLVRSRHPRWTDERIRAALAPILAGRTRWPSHSEFKALGLEGLHTALARRGRRNWADEYGLEYRNTGGAAPRWTEPRIAATLATLCSGRDTYPSQSDFAAAGLAGLYEAIARRPGGHARRARHVALPRRSWLKGDGAIRSPRAPRTAPS